MIKCLIFDSDGTLVDSEALGHRCMEQQLEKVGIVESAGYMADAYRGWKLADILAEVSKRNDGFEFSESFIPEYRAALSIMFEKELQPMPGVAEFLENVKLSVCLASSGPVPKIETALRVTGLKRFFGERIYSAYEIGAWKPDPALFLTAAKEMGFTPEECLVIEDSEVGVQGALAAGMKVIHYNPEKIVINASRSVPQIIHMNELESCLSKFTAGR